MAVYSAKSRCNIAMFVRKWVVPSVTTQLTSYLSTACSSKVACAEFLQLLLHGVHFGPPEKVIHVYSTTLFGEICVLYNSVWGTQQHPVIMFKAGEKYLQHTHQLLRLLLSV